MIELDLRKTILEEDGAGFELHFQPVVDVETRRPTGCEALVRWHRAGYGRLIGPAEFIPIVEETGLIRQLGELVLRRACAVAASWTGESLRLAVNVSPAQFRAPGLVQAVAEALSASGLDPHRLEIEITEGVLLDRTEETLAALHRLRALGVCLAMDDFGTGYSSLAYLRSFPFDRVKVDRSFVRDIEARADDASIVRAVNDLCLELGMTTVAEGVESEGQLRVIAAARCREAQGYLFSRPVPAEQLPAVLARLGRAALIPAEAAA
ncbi:MAG TPA: EAL domain-containing protein [Falsiroseomonas sp.]|nr:EAL domain-containing protein [Falsiroseomonas sp.]